MSRSAEGSGVLEADILIALAARETASIASPPVGGGGWGGGGGGGGGGISAMEQGKKDEMVASGREAASIAATLL